VLEAGGIGRGFEGIEPETIAGSIGRVNVLEVGRL